MTVSADRGSSHSHRKHTIALRDDAMFHRTMIARVAKQKELRLCDLSGNVHLGFITGWDEEWLQITTTEHQRLVLLQILNLSSIEETGKTLRNLESISSDEREEISRYMQTVYVRARETLNQIRQERSDDLDVRDASA